MSAGVWAQDRARADGRGGSANAAALAATNAGGGAARAAAVVAIPPIVYNPWFCVGSPSQYMPCDDIPTDLSVFEGTYSHTPEELAVVTVADPPVGPGGRSGGRAGCTGRRWNQFHRTALRSARGAHGDVPARQSSDALCDGRPSVAQKLDVGMGCCVCM